MNAAEIYLITKARLKLTERLEEMIKETAQD